MEITKIIASELNISNSQVEKTINLIDEGNTIPFIARYRKEVTGNLSDEQLRSLDERLTYLRNLEQRKNEVISSIESQGKMTDEIMVSLDNAITLAEVEDIYRPYKQKKKTRASEAKRKGLEPLAINIKEQKDKTPLSKVVENFLNDEVSTIEDAIQGAKDIIAEEISDDPEFRKQIKKVYYKLGTIETTSCKDEEKSAYEMYYNFSEKISTIPSHRILAINRGEKEEFLKVKLIKPEEKILDIIQKSVLIKGSTREAEILDTIKDSYERLIEPSIDREIRADLTEKADTGAIKVFGKNAKELLLGAPLKGLTVLGFDPAYRTGCKLAIIDETGKVLDTGVIYPTEPQNDIEGSQKTLINLISI